MRKANAVAAAKAIITIIMKKANVAAAVKAITTIIMKKVNAAAVSRRLDNRTICAEVLFVGVP